MLRISWASIILVVTSAHAATSVSAGINADDAAQLDPNGPKAASPTYTLPQLDPNAVASGKQIYQDFCEKCHGRDMVSSGGAFFDLRTFPSVDRQRFASSVTNGKRAMPAWGSVLKPIEIEALWAYVASRANPQ